MKKKDIETYKKIQIQLNDFCQKVLSTFISEFPEVGISDMAEPKGFEIIGEYLKMIYVTYLNEQPIFIPLHYVEAEDVSGFCKYYADDFRKKGRMMRDYEFIEAAFRKQWKGFYDLFDIRMTDSQEDLDRARNMMHQLIESVTFILFMNRKETDGKEGKIFREFELPSLNIAFTKFVEWARTDPFWSKREKSDEQRKQELKDELIASQIEIIEQIKQNEYHTDEELKLAEKALEHMKATLF